MILFSQFTSTSTTSHNFTFSLQRSNQIISEQTQTIFYLTYKLSNFRLTVDQHQISIHETEMVMVNKLVSTRKYLIEL